MNKRIRELALQAGECTNSVYTPPVRSKTPGKIWEDGHIDWHELYNEKFAVLIVEEMYDFIMDESANDNGIPDLGKVKQHFGVE